MRIYWLYFPNNIDNINPNKNIKKYSKKKIYTTFNVKATRNLLTHLKMESEKIIRLRSYLNNHDKITQYLRNKNEDCTVITSTNFLNKYSNQTGGNNKCVVNLNKLEAYYNNNNIDKEIDITNMNFKNKDKNNEEKINAINNFHQILMSCNPFKDIVTAGFLVLPNDATHNKDYAECDVPTADF